jgi:branched-chain amino acid transport system ATP-binding protein
MLKVSNLSAGYGRLKVIRDVSFTVADGSVVGVFGRNGAGKSTLMNSLVGFVHCSSGDAAWNDMRITNRRPDHVVRNGVGLVPQDRGLLTRESVAANLSLATYGQRISKSDRLEAVDQILEYFPVLGRLQRSLASSLSGGERQMLAIAKALIRQPKLLLLDEPSIGLAPAVVVQIQQVLRRIADENVTILITEQAVGWVLEITDSYMVLDQGRIASDGSGGTEADAQSIVASYLGRR